MSATENKQATPSSAFSRKGLSLFIVIALSFATILFFQNCGKPFETASQQQASLFTPGTSNPVVAGNTAPAVTITSPTVAVSSINAGQDLIVNVTATDTAPGRIQRVELLLILLNGQSQVVGTDNNAPYVLTANDVREGTYAYVVKATDNQGGYTTTASRQLNAVINPLDTLSACFAKNYAMPGWNNASDVAINYTVGLGPNAPVIANFDSPLSPKNGTRTVTDVNCDQVSGEEHLTIDCNPTRLRVSQRDDVECASGTIVVMANPRDDCMNVNDADIPKKKITINYTSVCPNENILKAEKALATTDVQTQAAFGSRVAFNGTYAVVVAQSYDATNSLNQLNFDMGAAYVYKKSGAEWNFHSRLLPMNAQQGEFITSAAIYGNTIVLGAPGSSGAAGRGQAFVYELSNNTWIESATIQSPLYSPAQSGGVTLTYPALANPAASEKLYFGFRVAVTPDNNILVSAYGEDIAIPDQIPFQDAGAVYKFAKNNSGIWEYKQKITAPTPSASAYFGYNLANDGYNLAVSAPMYGPAESVSNYGAVHLFSGSANGAYAHQRILKLATAPTSTLQFGAAVHVLGNYVLVGAPLFDSRKGTAYLFDRTTGTQIGAALTPGGNGNVVANDEFGASVQIHSIASDRLTMYVASPGRASKTGGIYKLEMLTAASTTNNATLKFILRGRTANRAPNAEFGKSMSIFGNEILVGSPGKTTDNLTNAGVGFVIATP